MTPEDVGGGYRFDRYTLDPADRRLTRDGDRVELNSRYLDALALLVGEAGRLVSKDRFMTEVWKGVPVTDEALTQCIRTLRKQLGDDAARPRFIETAPKHGYRFIAPVERLGGGRAAEDAAVAERVEAAARPDHPWKRFGLLGSAGMIGGGAAGLAGGLVYGLIGASGPNAAGMGTASVLLVLAGLTLWVGLVGGAGVGFGIAAANLRSLRPGPWSVLGGALGGLIVGGAVKLVGVDAFTLLFGQSPGQITGAGEGLLLGGAVGLGAWLGGGRLRRGLAAAGLTSAAAGLILSLVGGRLMAGSLDQLAGRFPDSRLQLAQLSALFGEAGLGPVSRTVSASLEGLLFGACVVGAMILARRSLGDAASRT